MDQFLPNLPDTLSAGAGARSSSSPRPCRRRSSPRRGRIYTCDLLSPYLHFQILTNGEHRRDCAEQDAREHEYREDEEEVAPAGLARGEPARTPRGGRARA